MAKNEILKCFQQIPGVGKSIAQDLYDLDFRSIDELKNQDPECLYERLNAQKGVKTCRCMLYVFRAAVYFANQPNSDPKLCQWWQFKD